VRESLQTYLKGNPTSLQATGVLRLAFALSFALQVFFALLLSVILLFVSSERRDNPLLSQIMIVLSFLQLPLALFISHKVSMVGNRQAYLSAAIMSGVLLSTPAWFAAMSFLSTTQTLYLLVFLLILMNYYALGFILCGRWGKHVPKAEVRSQESEVRS
jgi:hypothetical protein